MLEKVLPAQGLDFCLLMSSLSSILGGAGLVASAAASQFMDTFAERRSEAGPVPWVSVNWDAWRLEESSTMEGLSPGLAQLALQPEEGREAARRILTQFSGGQVVVSTSDLKARGRQTQRAVPSPGAARKQTVHPRPALATPYVAPRNDVERALTDIWRTLLGFNEVGVNDSFFELGGHSLLATQLRNHISSTFKVDPPLRSLFEKPTVAGIAALLEKELERSAAAQEKPIAERLRAAFPTERPGLLEEYLKRKIAKMFSRTPEQLPADGSLSGLDLPQLGAELEYDLRQDFKFQLYPHEVREHASIPDLARYLLAEMERSGQPHALPHRQAAVGLAAPALPRGPGHDRGAQGEQEPEHGVRALQPALRLHACSASCWRDTRGSSARRSSTCSSSRP